MFLLLAKFASLYSRYLGGSSAPTRLFNTVNKTKEEQSALWLVKSLADFILVLTGLSSDESVLVAGSSSVVSVFSFLNSKLNALMSFKSLNGR